MKDSLEEKEMTYCIDSKIKMPKEGEDGIFAAVTGPWTVRSVHTGQLGP